MTTEGKVNHWTDDEMILLTNIYSYHSNYELENIFNHSKNSISYKAIELGLKKNTWWTDDEIDLLKKYYPSMGAEKIKDMFLPNRSYGSIKKKAHELSIQLNKDLAFDIRDNNLQGRLTSSLNNHPDFKNCKGLRDVARNRIHKWRKDVLECYKHTCILTGDKERLVVHHIYPFSKIFYNTLEFYKDKFGFITDNDIAKCVELNGTEMVEGFLNEIYNRHSIKNGVVLSESIHDLFHSVYGTYYFSREDFYEFMHNYKNSELEGVVRHESRAKYEIV